MRVGPAGERAPKRLRRPSPPARAGNRRGTSITPHRTDAAPVLRIAPVLALALGMLLALAFSAPLSHAAPRGATDPAGSISGVVINGTRNGASVAGQQVTLRAIVVDRPHDAGTATTSADGRFTFGGLDTSGETTYEVYTHYQGGFFVTAPVTFGGGAAAAQTANLTIYDTTGDTTALRVSNLTVLISPVNKDKGLIPIGMFYTFENTGTHAVTGSLTAPTGGGMPQGVLRFALPATATNLTLGAGFADAQTVQISTGFAATATVLPGPASFAFAFDLPYTGTAAPLPLSAQYPTDRLTVLAPPAYRVSAPGFATDTPISANGQQFQQLHTDNLAAGAAKQVALAALPEAGVDPDLRFGQVLAIAAILALLLALLLALFAARGDLGALRRLAGRRMPKSRDVRRAPSQAQARAATRQRLLDALLDLDERHTAGAIGDAAYERRRSALRGELRALLAVGVLTPRPPRPAGRGGDKEIDHRGNGGNGGGERGISEDAEGNVRSQSVRLVEQETAVVDSDSAGASRGRPPTKAAARPATGATARSVRARRSRTTVGGG